MPIRNPQEMRRAISGRPAPEPRPVLSEQQRYMNRMRARTGGAVFAGAGLSASQTGGRPEGTLATLGGRGVQWTKGDDGRWGWLPFQTEGQMARAALASAQPAVLQSAVVAPPAPGLGAPVPVVTGGGRARAEALNTASQQAGGPNLSQPLVPKEAELAAKEYATAREANPLAAAPELIDQRSAAYEQRADIQAWAKANPELAAKLFAKQRREANPIQEMPAGAKLMGGDGSEQGAASYDAKRLAEYEQGGAPQQSVDAAMAAFTPRDLQKTPLVNSMLTPEGAAQGFQAKTNGLELVPQASAQAANIAFSPLPQANAAQGQMDLSKSAQLAQSSELGDLLSKYKGLAFELNAGKLNSAFGGI